MEKSIKYSLIVCCSALILGANIANAGQATIPHNFKSGDAAKASDVNQNFDALETEINDNDTRVSDHETRILSIESQVAEANKRVVAVDGNNNELGLVIGDEASALIYILTPEGYSVSINSSGSLGSGDTNGIVFTDGNCGMSGGSAYISHFSSNRIITPKSVISTSSFGNPQNQQLFYVPMPGTVVSMITYQSSLSDPQVGCSIITGTAQNAQQVLANDPAVTGIPNTPIPSPITIEYQ